jgi:hypothetical protein
MKLQINQQCTSVLYRSVDKGMKRRIGNIFSMCADLLNKYKVLYVPVLTHIFLLVNIFRYDIFLSGKQAQQK